MYFDMIPDNSTILISGDSITDCGRGRPYGTTRTGLGTSYVSFLHNIITGTYPEKHLKIVNAGISGDTSKMVRDRWDADMEAVKPDFAALMIGVNDVWRRYDSYMYPELQVTNQQYEENISYIIENALKNTKGFMLLSPFFLDLNKDDPMRRDTDQLNCILKRLSSKYGVLYCDIQSEIDKMLTKLHTTTYSPDRVHPFPHMHYTIAKTILKFLGFNF